MIETDTSLHMQLISNLQGVLSPFDKILATLDLINSSLKLIDSNHKDAYELGLLTLEHIEDLPPLTCLAMKDQIDLLRGQLNEPSRSYWQASETFTRDRGETSSQRIKPPPPHLTH